MGTLSNKKEFPTTTSSGVVADHREVFVSGHLERAQTAKPKEASDPRHQHQHARPSRIVLYAPQLRAHSSRGERTSKRRHHALRRAVEGVGADDVVGHVDELRPVAHEDALPAPRRHKLGERLHALRVERRVDLVEDAKGRGG